MPGTVVVVLVAALSAVAVAVAVRPREWLGHPELRSRHVGKWQED